MAEVAIQFRHDEAPRGESENRSRESSCSSLSTFSYFPPGSNSRREIQSRLQHLFGSAEFGRHNDGRELRGSQGPLLVARWRRQWPRFIANTPLMKCCGRRAIPIALRPTVSINLAVGMHHRTSPACRGLGAVDNVTSIETGGY